MKKNDYVSPEMEIVEIAEQNVLMASEGSAGGGFNPGVTPPLPPDDDED